MTQAPDFASIEHVYSAFSELNNQELRTRVEEPQFEIDVYDRQYRHVGECADYLDAKCMFANRVAPGSIDLPGDSEWGPWFRRCRLEPVLITIEVRGERWSGRVEDCTRERDEDGNLFYHAVLISDWAWLRSILAWPSPFLPIQTQFPRHDISVGPAITVLKGYLQKNLLRLQQPLWGIVNNLTVGGLVSSLGGIFSGSFRPVDFQNHDDRKPNDPLDPMEWLRGIANRANFPVAVKPADPFRDSSTWIALTARMTPMDELFEDVLRDEGLLLTAQVWLPEKDDPIPGLNLTAPTIVIDIVDKTYATGPNGNILTGLFRAVTRVLEDGVTKVLVPVDMPSTGLLAPNEPWIVIDEDDKGVISSKITAHHPTAKYCVIGGKSPQWLNQGVSLMIESALSAILSFVGQAGISSTLLNGLLDDVFMAFDRAYDANRVRDLGPYGFHEDFSAGGTVALSFSGLMNARKALWETRGYESYEFVLEDSAPYAAGEDFWLKDPVGVRVPGPSPEGEDQIYLQYVEMIEFQDSREGRVTTSVSIGDPHAGEDPTERALRKVKQITGFINALFLTTE